MQKFEKVMLVASFVLIIMLVWIFVGNANEEQTRSVRGSDIENTDEPLARKSGEMGAVTVDVVPESPSRYKISFNTHSVNLDFDFQNIIKLEDNKGKSYTPVSWNGGSGGHHLRGEMLFSTIDPNANSLTLTISGIENEVLSFMWELE